MLVAPCFPKIKANSMNVVKCLVSLSTVIESSEADY